MRMLPFVKKERSKKQRPAALKVAPRGSRSTVTPPHRRSLPSGHARHRAIILELHRHDAALRVDLLHPRRSAAHEDEAALFRAGRPWPEALHEEADCGAGLLQGLFRGCDPRQHLLLGVDEAAANTHDAITKSPPELLSLGLGECSKDPILEAEPQGLLVAKQLRHHDRHLVCLVGAPRRARALLAADPIEDAAHSP